MITRTQYRWGLLLPLMAISGVVGAQNEEDAYRISNVRPGGTGRSSAIANAFGALGADPASIAINPAGFGLYRTSEVSITPSFEVNDARSTYYGSQASDVRTRFFFNNLALVLNSPSEKEGKWRSATYGVVYDRQETHHWQRLAMGDQVPSTILQGFVNEANGTQAGDLYSLFPFTSGLAWNSYGIDPLDSTSTIYVPAIPFGSPTEQVHSIDSHGASNNTSFFYSNNYLDRLYIGASLGIAGHKFQRTTEHTETSQDENLDLNEVRYTEELNTTGNGFDIKIGLIGRVTDHFRLGVAYHSPQWMQMRDDYATAIHTSFRTLDSNGVSTYEAYSPDGSFNYNVNTPWRGVISAAYIAGERGLVSLDYEYTDFRKMRIKPSDRIIDDYDFNIENDAIRTSFRAVHTVRVGTEWRAGNWYYRLGWGYSPNGYQTNDPRHGQAMRTYAGGLGYRTDHIGVDLGLNFTDRTMNYFQYDPSTVETTLEERQNYRAMLTLSFRP